MLGRILSIAGTDPSGGAGIHADIKTITALNGYAMTAITALVAQNTVRVTSIVDVSNTFIEEQIDCIVDDIGVDSIKIGMLHKSSIVELVSSKINNKLKSIPLVVDPVMFSKNGDRLIEDEACDAIKKFIIPISTILTPNNPEAEKLTGDMIKDDSSAIIAAKKIIRMGAKAVLMKGGHRSGSIVKDILVYSKGIEVLESSRQKTTNTHGTGCTLSAAIATYLGQKVDLVTATKKSNLFVQDAIRMAPSFGKGSGPLNHCHLIKK